MWPAVILLVMETNRHYHGHLDSIVYQCSLIHMFVWAFVFFGCSKWKEKMKTENGVATLISVKIGKYIKFCTFLKNPLHCEIPALTVQWQCLYGPLSTCNCYLDISQECVPNVVVCPSAIPKSQKAFQIYVTNVWCILQLHLADGIINCWIGIVLNEKGNAQICYHRGIFT